MHRLVLAGVLSLSLITACNSVSVPRGTVTPQPAQCEPTDQDAYVYSPDRLEVLAPCIRVTGIIKNTLVNPFDGDATMGLELDPPYRSYVTDTNRAALGGSLHIEVICFTTSLIMNPRAKSACSQNPHPMRSPLPEAAQHV